MRWEKPEQLAAEAYARPLRVAYLVDLNECPDRLLDAIFAEAYSRWGGRRTLIVPASTEGIDPRYEDWLSYYDPDIIYSFVALSDTAVAACHERFGPAHLVLHRQLPSVQGEMPRYGIELPLKALSSLSVLSLYVSRNFGLGFDGPPRNVQLLTKYAEQVRYPFLRENFGFVSASFPYGLIPSGYPDLFTCFTLITEHALADNRMGKDARATHITSEDAVLDALAQRSGPLTVAQLSEFLSPYLEVEGGIGREGTCIVVGETPADRLLFWNIHHHFQRCLSGELTTLRLPLDRIDDKTFLGRIRELMQRRGVANYSGNNHHVTLQSCSVDQAVLDSLATSLRTGPLPLGVIVRRHADPAGIVPTFRDRDARWFLGGGMAEPPARATAEFHGRRVPVPLAMPWHMREALPPAGLRSGNWMVDVTVDRLTDHSASVNQRHVWLMPRRLRLEGTFELECEAARNEGDEIRVIRVTRSGQMSIPISTAVSRISLTAPEDDLAAIRGGVCNHSEWRPFDRNRKDAPQGRERFVLAEPSDKGRYLIGTLSLFNGLSEAFAILMNGFWRQVLKDLGGTPSDKDNSRRDEIITTLRKRVGQRFGPLTFDSEEQLDRLAREVMRVGRMIGRGRRHVTYGELRERWQSLVDVYLQDRSRAAKSDDDAFYRDEKWLNESLQLLCQREVLFQGREWRCRSCYNRNWVPIQELDRTLHCGVCGRAEPAPVEGHWHFRANPFLLEAYRDHGTEVMVWVLFQLADRARRSFYFSPSLKLWCTYPRDARTQCDVEIDAIAIVDGTVWLVEATSGGAFSESELSQIVLASDRIRPDMVVLASTEDAKTGLERAVTRLQSMIRSSVTTVDAWTFDPHQLDRRPILPRH